MYKALLVTGAIALASVSTNAFAASGAATGAAGGAVTGAIVGGPVGAAVGGVAGAITGAALDAPPREVVTYVERQPMVTGPAVEEHVVVGKPIPSSVEVIPIPNQPRYAYAIVNHQRVIIEPQTHRVVQIVP
jgi:hypothetical protein